MRHFLIYIALFLAALVPAGCTDIDEADRYERVERVEPQKNVLIEEFTGQRCVNCPLAAEQVEALRRLYPDNVIAVAIHGGALAVSEEQSPLGLANAQSEALTAERGITAWPKGIIDRSGEPSDFEAWGSAVLRRLLVTPRIGLRAEAPAYDEDTRRLSVTVSTTATHAVEGRLHLWLTEDSIVTTQAMPKEWSDAHDGQAYDRAYRADHVFRAVAGSADGVAQTLHAGDTVEHSFDCVLKEKWNAANMRLVIFFTTDEGVEQVIQENIINP